MRDRRRSGTVSSTRQKKLALAFGFMMVMQAQMQEVIDFQLVPQSSGSWFVPNCSPSLGYQTFFCCKQLAYWLMLLGNPMLFQFLFCLRMKKQFWPAARRRLWECQFLSSYRVIGDQFPSWEDAKYKQCFRLEKEVFIRLNT